MYFKFYVYNNDVGIVIVFLKDDIIDLIFHTRQNCQQKNSKITLKSKDSIELCRTKENIQISKKKNTLKSYT